MTTPHMPETFEKMVADIQHDAYEIMIERQRKYGPHNITRHGLTGVIVRAGDKLARLDHLALSGHPFIETMDESVEDTLLDLMNYALIGLAVHRGYWTPAHCPPLAESHGPLALAGEGGRAVHPIAYADRDGDRWYPEDNGDGWRVSLVPGERASDDSACAHVSLDNLRAWYGPLEPIP